MCDPASRRVGGGTVVQHGGRVSARDGASGIGTSGAGSSVFSTSKVTAAVPGVSGFMGARAAPDRMFQIRSQCSGYLPGSIVYRSRWIASAELTLPSPFMSPDWLMG